MNTSPNYHAAIDSEKDPLVSFVRTEADRKAIPASEVLVVNVDGAPFAGTALGALRNLTVILEQLAELPDFDVKAPDKLEDYALAFLEANTRHLGATQLPDDLAAMREEATATRNRFRVDYRALVARGLLPEDILSGCTWQPGFINVATDLELITGVFMAQWKSIERKCGIDRSELDRARKLATRMIRQSGERATALPSAAETADTRARAFTLLIRCYDEICRGVTYVRWREGDAEQIAPSLYKGRRRFSKEADKPSEHAPAPN